MIVFFPLFWFLLYFLGKIEKETGKNKMKRLARFMIVIIDK
jgi:hypothetical protein